MAGAPPELYHIILGLQIISNLDELGFLPTFGRPVAGEGTPALP